MDSEIVKVRYDKNNGVYSVGIPAKFHSIAVEQKYLKCNVSENGEIVYSKI